MLIFKNRLLWHDIEYSRWVPPLQVYNARIVWKRAEYVRSRGNDVQAERKLIKYKWRRWLPKKLHLIRLSLPKYFKIMHLNAWQYYSNLSRKKKYRILPWLLPYCYVRRVWQPWKLKHFKNWVRNYRLPILFRRFYTRYGYNLPRFKRLHKRALRRLIVWVRQFNKRIYLKYVKRYRVTPIQAVTKNRQSTKSFNHAVGNINRSSSIYSCLYRRLSMLQLLAKILFKAIKYNNSNGRYDNLVLYISKIQRNMRELLNKQVGLLRRTRQCLSFLGRRKLAVCLSKVLVARLSGSLKILQHIMRKAYSMRRSRLSNSVCRYLICDKPLRYRNYRNSFSDISNMVPIKRRSTKYRQRQKCSSYRIARLFYRYATWRRARVLGKYQRLNTRCATLKLRDLSIRSALCNPTFFYNVFYYSTKVRTLCNISLLWCDIQIVASKRNLFFAKRSLLCTLFFFRNIYFSEFSRGLLAYVRHRVSMFPVFHTTKCISQSNMICTYKLKILSFFLKYMYIDFLYSFISAHTVKPRWLSHTFLLYMLLNLSKRAVAYSAIGLLRKHSIRFTFFNFVNGYINDQPLRLLFVLGNTLNSTFFTFWILRLYFRILHNIRLRSVIQKTFVLFMLQSRHSVKCIEGFRYIFIKLVALSINRSLNFSIDNYYVLTTFVFNSNTDNFRIFNVAVYLFLAMLRVGTNMFKLREILFMYSVRLFTHQVEYTLFSFTKVQYFFFARYYYDTIPPLNNARMLCNYLIIKIASGSKIKEAFDGVYTWQTYWKENLAREYLKYININCDIDIREFIYPVKGIRIICSGPAYKARRTRAVKYLVWVSDEYLTGKMPLSTVNLNIEYIQSHVVLRRSVIGIKVWLLFEDEVKFK